MKGTTKHLPPNKSRRRQDNDKTTNQQHKTVRPMAIFKLEGLTGHRKGRRRKQHLADKTKSHGGHLNLESTAARFIRPNNNKFYRWPRSRRLFTRGQSALFRLNIISPGQELIQWGGKKKPLRPASRHIDRPGPYLFPPP